MVSVLFALLTALFNGLASVLQRMAASTAPAAKALHLSLFGYLIRHKVWLAGIGMVILASVCQATALATGPVALVQPIFIIELPFTLLVASKLAHRKLPRMTWYAVGLVTVALGAGLAAAAPSGGGDYAPIRVWVLTLIVTAVFEAVLITIGVRAGGNARAATFGLAAACGYALTATLMKSAVSTLDQHGFVAFLSTWELYGTAVAGVGALFLLQNALQAARWWPSSRRSPWVTRSSARATGSPSSVRTSRPAAGCSPPRSSPSSPSPSAASNCPARWPWSTWPRPRS